MFTYKDIANELLDKIKDSKLKVNDKLPSEKALMIKHNVSRIVISRVFFELKKIGAIYSIPKKGNFVAKYFHGLIKPLQSLYNIDKILDYEIKIKKCSFFKEQNIFGEYKTIERNYYSSGELIIQSQCWMVEKLNYVANESLLGVALKDYSIISSIIISVFEKFKENDKNKSLVNYRVVYDEKGVVLVYRYTISEKHYISYKQEFNI